MHCTKSVQIRSFFCSLFSCIWTEYGDLRSKVFRSNTGKYGPEKLRIWTLYTQWWSKHSAFSSSWRWVMIYIINSGNSHCVKKCSYSEFFWSAFSRIRTEYGEIWSISPYSVRMRENKDQKNYEHRHFSRSKKIIFFLSFLESQSLHQGTADKVVS